MVTSTNVSQYGIINKSININHQRNRIIKSNIDDSANCAKKAIENSVNINSCNFAAYFNIPSPSSCKNYKSKNVDNSSNLNNKKSHNTQEESIHSRKIIHFR